MSDVRPIWRGHLRLALVSCPVALHAAHHEHGNLHFHLINPATGHRVRMQALDAGMGREVSRGDLVRGYEFRKGEYLVLSDEDFESARIESSSVLTIDKFVPADAIDPLYYDTGYYVTPDGQVGADVFVVLREAIARSKRLALSRVVLARRERAVAIRAMGAGMVLHTLQEARDIHDAAAVFADIPQAPPDPEMVKLAMQLIERQGARFVPADIEDRYEARLRELIAAKLKGEGIAPEAQPEEPRGKVIDLMQALKNSLGATGKAAPSGGPRPKPRPKSRPAHKAAAHKAG